MSHERDTDGNGSDGGEFGGTGATTKRTDFARLIGINLGLAITEVGRRIAETFRKLSEVSGARRRAILEGALDELDEIVDTIEDAKTLIREQVKTAYKEKDGIE